MELVIKLLWSPLAIAALSWRLMGDEIEPRRQFIQYNALAGSVEIGHPELLSNRVEPESDA